MDVHPIDARKDRILRAIIDDYIQTALPVGSRTISRKYETNLSSATIRNEMSDLEELGYLDQPHISAGRVPSVKAYRLYVDELLEEDPLPQDPKAREYFSRASECAANNYEKFYAYVYYSQFLYENNEMETCEKYLKKAEELLPDNRWTPFIRKMNKKSYSVLDYSNNRDKIEKKIAD